MTRQDEFRLSLLFLWADLMKTGFRFERACLNKTDRLKALVQRIGNCMWGGVMNCWILFIVLKFCEAPFARWSLQHNSFGNIALIRDSICKKCNTTSYANYKFHQSYSSFFGKNTPYSSQVYFCNYQLWRNLRKACNYRPCGIWCRLLVNKKRQI